MSIQLSSFGLSDTGKVRQNNEDVFAQLPESQFFALADGMGGHYAGHEASRDVSRIIAQHVLDRIYLPLVKKSTHTTTQSQEPIRDVMLDAIQIANQKTTVLWCFLIEC